MAAPTTAVTPALQTTPPRQTGGTRILALDSLVNRQTVVLPDGREFELLDLARMPPLKNHEFRALAMRADALADKTELTDDERAELEAIPARMCRLVLRAPGDVIDALDDYDRMAIIALFMTPAAQRIQAATPEPSPTGAISSPASAGSTAATR